MFGPGLLGLEDEAAALVQVDAQGGGHALGVAPLHPALEDVVVKGGVVAGGVGRGDADGLAQLAQEHLIVGALGPAPGRAPFANEFLEVQAVLPLWRALRPCRALVARGEEEWGRLDSLTQYAAHTVWHTLCDVRRVPRGRG